MKKVNAKLYTDLPEFLGQCDVVTINMPLTGKFCSTDASWKHSLHSQYGIPIGLL